MDASLIVRKVCTAIASRTPSRTSPVCGSIRRLSVTVTGSGSTDDASLGIAQASVVDDPARLKERIEFVLEQHKSDVLVEEYIEGRELYVGMMGDDRLTRFPVWELNFGSMAAASGSAIATRKAKWDLKYRAKYGIDSAPAVDLPPGTVVMPCVHLKHRRPGERFPQSRQ